VEDPPRVDGIVPGAGADTGAVKDTAHCASGKAQCSAAQHSTTIKTQVWTLCSKGIVKICANKQPHIG